MTKKEIFIISIISLLLVIIYATTINPFITEKTYELKIGSKIALENITLESIDNDVAKLIVDGETVEIKQNESKKMKPVDIFVASRSTEFKIENVKENSITIHFTKQKKLAFWKTALVAQIIAIIIILFKRKTNKG